MSISIVHMSSYTPTNNIRTHPVDAGNNHQGENLRPKKGHVQPVYCSHHAVGEPVYCSHQAVDDVTAETIAAAYSEGLGLICAIPPAVTEKAEQATPGAKPISPVHRGVARNSLLTHISCMVYAVLAQTSTSPRQP